MKYTFPITIDFGKLDNGESEIEIELTDEEASRMRAAAADKRYRGFDECGEAADIYDRIYPLAERQCTDEYLECNEIDEDWVEEDEEWMIGDTFPLTVHFPREMEPLD